MDPAQLPTSFQPLVRRISHRATGIDLHCLAEHFELCDPCLQALPDGKHLS